MKKEISFSIFALFVLLTFTERIFGQSTFIQSQPGAWNLGTTWGGACSSGCVAGTDFPGALDAAIINGTGGAVTLPRSGFNPTFQVGSLLFTSTAPATSLTTSGVVGNVTLQINGQLYGVDPTLSFNQAPTNAVILTTSNNLRLTFTGSDANLSAGDPIITSWGYNAPLRVVNLNLSGGISGNFDGFSIADGGTLTVQSGTGNLTATQPLRAASGATSGTITVSSAAALVVQNSILLDSSTPSSRFPTINVNGTLTSFASNSTYVNATTITLGAGAIFNVDFNGSNQTQGWWFQSSSPSTFSADPASTVNFSASTAQNIFAQTYGSLTLSGTGSFTKGVVGGGSLNIRGNLTFNNAGITLNVPSANQVIFNGAGSQSINGGGTATFNGGLQVNKSAGTLTLSQNLTVQNGLTLTSGTFDLGTNTLSLSGNLNNNATLTPSTSTVSIISGSTTIGGSSSTTFSNLIITASGSLTSPSSLSISGNFTNNGTFNANNGTVTFSGSSAQSIAGTATFNNINCNNAAGVNITGNINLGGVLTLNSSGLFDADGPSDTGVFTVLSTSVNAGGRIASLPIPSNFIGDVTIQRFIHSQTGGDWRYISVPITTGNNLGLVQTAIGVTGNFSDRSTSAQFPNVVDAGNTNPSVFTNTGAGFVAVNGSGGTVASTSLSSRVGYAAYNFNNGPVTASYRGQIEKGNSIPIAISSTNGNYNLVPNPFPSAIDWDNVTKSTVNDAIWLRTANNIFTSYVGGVGSPANEPFVGWTGEIAIGQAFWVQSNGAGSTLTFKEADKTSNSFEFLRQEEPINYFRVKLASATQSDDAVIRFHENGSDNFNPNFDAPKRKNGNYVSSLGANSYLNISTYVLDPGTDYSINTVGMINCSKSIKIKLEDAMLGNYTMTFGDLDKMQLGYSIVLRDNLLNKDVAVNESTSYTFAVTSDPTTYGSNRFVINFTSPQVAPNAPNYTFSNLCESQIQYQLNTQAGINYQITKGGSVLATVIGNGNQVSGFISRGSFNTGNNVFDLQAASQDGCNKVAFPGVLSINLQQTPSVVSVLSTTVCNSGTSTLTAVGAPADGQYRWYFSADAKNSIAGQIGSAFTTPVISETTSFFVATINGQGCEGPRTSVQAVVSKLAKPSISVTGFVLSSSISEGNQWFKNGAKIEGATGSTITVLESGTYSVSVQNAAGCTQTSDNLVMSIAALEDARSLGISIYPNPAAEELKMKIPTPMVEKITSLGVIDIKGSGSVYLDAIQEDVTIPVGHLPSGVYFARIKIGNEFKFLRFIKK